MASDEDFTMASDEDFTMVMRQCARCTYLHQPTIPASVFGARYGIAKCCRCFAKWQVVKRDEISSIADRQVVDVFYAHCAIAAANEDWVWGVKA